ncbi:MAG: capsule assembly Wzi family protein [bacterium]
MKVRLKVLFLLPFLIIFVETAQAAQDETLPTYHWAYEYLDQLWLRGHFQELFILNRPFTRGQIASAVVLLRQEMAAGKVGENAYERWLLQKLEQEFRTEITQLRQDTANDLLIGSYINQGVHIRKSKFNDQTQLRSRMSFSPLKNLAIINTILIDNRLDENPFYQGKRRYNIAGYTEQAYLRFSWKLFHVTVGREFVRWGAGHSATLLFSDSVRPFDLFKFNLGLKKIKFTFFTAMLDGVTEDVMINDLPQSAFANRYLAAHRLDIKLTSWFNLSFTESILYGGVDRNFEFAYLNPFLFYHGNLLNGPGPGNTIGVVDWYLTPVKNAGFYGSFMIDDIQLDHKQVDDLEPNELGLIVGIKAADLFSVAGSNVLLEYTRITNRTYNSMHRHEKYLHRNFPIGHYLGNDFDRWQIEWRQWLKKNLEAAVSIEQIRKGEGDMRKSFDMPWRNSTVEQGYREPFPTGVVERTRLVNLQVYFHPLRQLRFAASTQYQKISNYLNQTGVNQSAWTWQLRVWWAPEINIGLH